jgi:hypothetical protein
VPKTLHGKGIALVWMLLGVYLMSLFTAALTSALVIQKKSSAIADVNVRKVEDIALYTAGVSAFDEAFGLLMMQAPGVRLKRYEREDLLLEAVDKAEQQVGVMDSRVAAYHTSQGQFKRKVRAMGPTFAIKGVTFGVSRPSGDHHAVYFALKHALIVVIEASRTASAPSKYQELVQVHLPGGSADLKEGGLVNEVILLRSHVQQLAATSESFVK